MVCILSVCEFRIGIKEYRIDKLNEYLAQDWDNDVHTLIIEPSLFGDEQLDGGADEGPPPRSLPLTAEVHGETMMSTSEDEPLSPKGRLRPRRLSVAGPPRKTRTQGRVRKEKDKRASKPSKNAPLEEAIVDSATSSSSILKVFCPYCVKKFTSKRSITKHVKRTHLYINSKSGYNIKCQYCDHSETDPDAIVRHMLSSHSERYFACPECHTRTATAGELAAHAARCDRRKPLGVGARARLARRAPPAADTADAGGSATTDVPQFKGVVISCELKPSQTNEHTDIEDNITTNFILPPSKTIGSSMTGEKNAVIVLDDIEWNKKIAGNLSSFHKSDAEQILSRLGVVHRAPRAGGGELPRKDWQKHLEDTTKFEKCFDTSFYSKVASNVHENLAKFLDGSFSRPLDPESIIKTRKSKNSVVINTAEGFPILLAGEQCARSAFDSYLPRALAPKHKWKWDNPETDKHPVSADQIKRDSHANNCIITLISSLDIWTQLCMRQKFEDKYNNISFNEKKTEKNNVICYELKKILESREIPNKSGEAEQSVQASTSFGSGSGGGSEGARAQFPAWLGLAPTPPRAAPPPAVLSGEWVRPRCYVCCACGERTHDAKSLSAHISSQHPNAQVSHYDIGGELHLDPEILKHFNVLPSPTSSRSRPLRGVRECTKCKKPVSLEDLHQHMLECAGDAPVVKRKCRYRPFGVRRRRTRAPAAPAVRIALRKDGRRKTRKNYIRPRTKVRSEVGDGETIRKMLADLPPKRHRVNVNPLNQAHMSKKRDLRKTVLVKRRGSDETKIPKGNKQTDRRETKTRMRTEKKLAASTSGNNETPKSNLRPRLARANKLPRRSEMKAKYNTRPKTRQTKDKTENGDSDSDSKDKKSLSTVPTEQMSNANTSQRMNVNTSGSGSGGGSGRSGGDSAGRQHVGRNTRGGGGTGASGAGSRSSRSAPGGGEGSGGASRINAPQTAPLKHSIASLTANTETHDKAVQFQPHFLVNQECYKNIEKSYSPYVFYQDETPANKLDKPPLSSPNILADPFAHQKCKLNKPRKGLNDCIAMLKNKLEDPAPCVVTAQQSVQCNISEAAALMPPPPPPPAPVASPAPAPAPAPPPLSNTLYPEFPIPPAHTQNAFSISSTPLDLSGKSSHGHIVTVTEHYETLDLSKKNVHELAVPKDDEDVIVDLSMRSIKPSKEADITLDLSSKRIKDDLTELAFQREYSNASNIQGAPSIVSHVHNMVQLMSDNFNLSYQANVNQRSKHTNALTVADSKTSGGGGYPRAASVSPQPSTSYLPNRVDADKSLVSSSLSPIVQPSTSLTTSYSSLQNQNEQRSRVPPVTSSPGLIEAQELDRLPLTSNALVTSTSSVNPEFSGEGSVIPRSGAIGVDHSRGVSSNIINSASADDMVAMLPKEIVDILGKMPNDHRDQLLSILPQYMAQNAATKHLKLVVDILPDANKPVPGGPPGTNTNPEAPNNTQKASSENANSTETIPVAKGKACPKELLNVDTEMYLIDPVTGAITERGPRELENRNARPTDTEVNFRNGINSSTKPDSTLAQPLTPVTSQITPSITPLPSSESLREVKEKTASLRAVRIKPSDRRRKNHASTSNVHLNSLSAEAPVPTNEPLRLEKRLEQVPYPENSNTQTSNSSNKVLNNNTSMTVLQINKDKNLNIPEQSITADYDNKHQENNSESNSHTLTKSLSSCDNIKQNNTTDDAPVINRTGNKKQPIEINSGINSETISKIDIPQTKLSADSTTIQDEAPASASHIEPETKLVEKHAIQDAVVKSVDDCDSDDNISLAVIFKQKQVEQTKKNKNVKKKRNKNRKKSKRNTEAAKDAFLLSTETVNTDILNSDKSPAVNDNITEKSDPAVSDTTDNVIMTPSDIPESNSDDKKRRSRRNKTNKNYNENSDVDLPLLAKDKKESLQIIPIPNISLDEQSEPIIANGDNNNDHNSHSENSKNIESELNKQDCSDPIVMDLQAEESQDTLLNADEIYIPTNKPKLKITRKRSKRNFKKEVCEILDSKVRPTNHPTTRIMDLDTTEDSNYASDSTENSRSTVRAARTTRSLIKDIPKSFNLDDISQSSSEICSPLRRSRRGKSLYLGETVADDPVEITKINNDKASNLENKMPFTKKQLIFSKMLLDDDNRQNEVFENIEETEREVPSKILKDHSDPSNELNASDIPLPSAVSCTIDEDKPTETLITNKCNKPSKRKKTQTTQKESKKRKSLISIINESSTKEESDVSTNIILDTDDTVTSFVSNDMSIVDENEKPLRDAGSFLDKLNIEPEKNTAIAAVQQNLLEKISKKDSNDRVYSEDESISDGSNILRQSHKKTTEKLSSSVTYPDSVRNSPQTKRTRLSKSKMSDTDDYDFSDKDTNLTRSNDHSDTEINNGFLQKFAKPMTCYDIPVAAARTRSKPFWKKSVSEDYDPYDIDQEDKLFEDATCNKQAVDIMFDSDKSVKKHSKAKKSNKQLKKSRKNPGKSSTTKSKVETVTSEKITNNDAVTNDSDDSSKSDVPLKRFVSDFAKNSNIPKADSSAKQTDYKLKINVVADLSSNKERKSHEKMRKRKSKRGLSKSEVPNDNDDHHLTTDHSVDDQKPNVSNVDIQNKLVAKSPAVGLDNNQNANEEVIEPKQNLQIIAVESKGSRKTNRRAMRAQENVVCEEKQAVNRIPANEVVVEELAQERPVAADVLPAPAPQANEPVPIADNEERIIVPPPNERNEVRQQEPGNQAQANKPTQAKICSQQFLESFGFYAERTPRKSNLLATKKIAETFHIIESEELKVRKKINKKSERRKSVSNIAIDAPSTSAQTPEAVPATAPPPAVEKENEEVAKKADPKLERNCDVCKKVFRRHDNLMRHQIISLHLNGLKEINNELEEEEPDYLIIFRHRLDCLRKTQLQNDKRRKKGKNSKSSRNKSPVSYDIIAEAKSQTKHIMSSNKTVARRGLSRDEELFLDCCELLNKCEAGGAEATRPAPAAAAQEPAPGPAAPAQGPSGLASLKTFDRLISEDRCDSQSDGDVDSITAKNILESEEVRNLENDLISGLKEAAEKKMASQRAAAEIPPKVEPAPIVVRASRRRCVNCRTLDLFREYEKQDNLRQAEPEPVIDLEVEEAAEAAEVEEVRVSPPPPGPPPPGPPPPGPATADHALPSGSGIATERKRKKSESMKIDQLEIVDLFEDKFDKIKRKCRSQAAAAKQTATLVEATKSTKEKKKVEKKKNKKYSKKKLHGAIPTKGALKGFDGIKVSIPTTDIDISAIVPNLPNSGTDAPAVKKRKKNNKKRRSSNKADSEYKLKFDDHDGASTSAQSKLDVYEFSDNDQELELEFRPAALAHLSKTKGSTTSTRRATPSPAAAAAGPARARDSSSSSGSDNDDFVYMSDDYLCSADETENSLLSCETTLAPKQLTNDVKKSAPKKKDAVDKNAVMGKIFKNNAVRSEKYLSKTKDSGKSPKANLDQLFDSLLEDEPSSSMLKEDNESLLPASPVSRRESGAATPMDVISDAAPNTAKMPLMPFALDKLTDTATQTSETFDKIVRTKDKKTTKKKKIDTSYGSDRPKPKKRCKKQSLDFEKTVFDRYSDILSADRSGNDTPDASAERSDLSLLDESGVARHRARRKCAVGKQNVLAESWSSESEPDEGFSGRGAGPDATAARKKRSKKEKTARRSRNVTFKKQEAMPCSKVIPVGESDGEDEVGAPALAAHERREGRSRSEVAYYWSSEEEAGAPAQPPQHGWIVGDSHKKLVTMLAHAKGRKRDDKRHHHLD